MNRRNWWDVRAEANGGDQGGGGGGAVQPAAAREFLTQWAPNPDIVTGMKDEEVMAWHGNVSQRLTAAQQEAVKNQDWRAPIVAVKPDAKPTLDRFASPVALFETYDQLRTKLSKGELRAVTEFPAKGTADQQAEWRQQNGVPVDGKYELKLPAELKLTEDDQPLVDRFTKYAHENNIPASEVNKTATWFFGERAARQAEAAEAFEAQKQETAATLGAEWGADYKGIKNRIGGVLDASIPADEDGGKLKESIQKAIDTNPMFARMWAKIALEMNPAGTLVPGDRGANEGTITDEIKKIEERMKKDRAGYNKDEPQRKRYGELLGAYQKTTGKEWNAPTS